MHAPSRARAGEETEPDRPSSGGAPAMGGSADEEGLLAALDRDDRYRAVRVLADGGSGVTELVEPRAGAGTGSPAAAGMPALLVRKRIPAPVANEAAWRAAAACTCPRVPAVRDLYRMPGSLTVVYDYVEGTPLSQLLGERGGRLSERLACALALDVCEAASALHRLGVVHRDITPSNVVVAADGAHLTDLGIARLAPPAAGGGLDAPGDPAPHDTTTLGTVGFAAPEQFGFAATDARADVYAIGRLLATMVCGMRAEGADGAGAPADQLRELRESSPAVASVVAKACAFDRADRFQSAEELAGALAREFPQLARAGGPASPAEDRGPTGAPDPGRLFWGGRAVSPARLLLCPPPPPSIARAARRAHRGGRLLASALVLVAVLVVVSAAVSSAEPGAAWRTAAAPWSALCSDLLVYAWVLLVAGFELPAFVLRAAPYDAPGARPLHLVELLVARLCSLLLVVTLLIGLLPG